jgi:four helix bundle protein
MAESARNFRKYKVWQDAVAYASHVYEVTSKMPWFEKKGLCDQLQRAAVSISSNIAEGAARTSDAEFARFLDIALGSAFEVETQLKIANNVGYFDNLDVDIRNDNLNDNLNPNKGEVTYEVLMDKIHSIERQLNGLISSIRKS